MNEEQELFEVGTLRSVKYVAEFFKVTEITVRRWIHETRREKRLRTYRMPDAKPDGKASYWTTDEAIRDLARRMYGSGK